MRSATSVPYTRQHIDEDDIAAVNRVLGSDWLTGGPAINAFENLASSYCSARHAVAMSSASTALHAVCLALGVGPGDRVWTSPNSFVASADCALQCGALVDFVDIDPHTYNLSVSELERKLAFAEVSHTLPKVVILVHFGGRPCDLAGIAALARRYGVAVVEDASHALGATYRDSPIGSCVYSDATVISFHATKSITTGEGGMVLTNRAEVAGRVSLLRSHGISRPSNEAEPWRYEKVELGFNYRMTDMQAALGTSQLAKLGKFVERRTELAQRYDRALAGLSLQLPHRDADSTSAWHLYPVQVLGEDRSERRLMLFSALLQHGVRSQVHFIPIHTQPYYRDRGFGAGDFPVAERYYEGTLSLPLFYDLIESDQDRVIEIVRAVRR
jgi:UDP-4-amino-4,6-dideoxy-N-acetyl-beta-L-altrosamine transaminase